MRNSALCFSWDVLKFCAVSSVASKAVSYKGQISNRLVIGRADHLHAPLYIWEIVFVAQIRLKNTKERLSEILQSLGLLPVPYLRPGHLSEMQKGLWNSQQIFRMGLWTVILFCRSCGAGGKATGLLLAFQPSPQKCLLFVYDTAHHVVRTTEFASADHIWKWSEVEKGAVGWTALWKCGPVIQKPAFRSYVSVNW